MNDAEIIKALECCVESECEGCKYEYDTACKEYILHDCIRLINLQKAEIDKLKIEICALSEKRITFPERLKIVKHARESAIKEFAEKLKANFAKLDYRTDTQRKTCNVDFCNKTVNWAIHDVTSAEIDNLVSEYVTDINVGSTTTGGEENAD